MTGIINNLPNIGNNDKAELDTRSYMLGYADGKEAVLKELSDEEIKQLIVQHIQTWNSLDSIIDFARAILKKASEK